MVYIILVNFNYWKNTVECLESILNSNYQNYKVIVVDNGSENDSRQQLISWAMYGTDIAIPEKDVIRNIVYPLHNDSLDYSIIDDNELELDAISLSRINFVFKKENNGLAAAWNTAFKVIKKCRDLEFVWLLGSDTVIPHESIGVLVSYAKKHPRYDVFGTLSLYYFEPSKIQCCGFGYGSSWTGLYKHLLANQYYDRKEKSKYIKALERIRCKDIYVYGNSIVMNNEVFNKLDYFDTQYFIYYEELELMQQLKRHDIEVGLCADCIVYHKESATINAQGLVKSPLSEYYLTRNRIIFTKKFFPYKLITVYIVSLLIIINRIRKGYLKIAVMLLQVLFNPKPQFVEFKKRNGWLNI